jgi:transposase-like protein
MKRNTPSFKWRHYAPDVILLCVRWYCRYQLSYRDVEEMMRERGLDVDTQLYFVGYKDTLRKSTSASDNI